MSRNQLAQYHRSSLNVILAGIPLQPNEQSDNPWEVLKVIDKVAVKGGFTGYNKGDIDVAHRLPAKKGNPSIIIRFKSKSARMNFYTQRAKLRGVTAESLDRQNGDAGSGEVSFRGVRGASAESKIYILESLTQFNGELLKEAKTIAKGKGYEFYGYTVNGEVCVNKLK